MFGILISAFNVVLGYILRTVIIKFVILASMFIIASLVATALKDAGMLPSISTLTNAFGGLSPGFWYFADLSAANYGIPLVLSAYVSRFVIRRIK